MGQPLQVVFVALLVPVAWVGLGWVSRRYLRTASVTVTAGLVYCSAVLVVFSRGAIEAHFHFFFIIIGFTALYQDWAPFLFNILFTMVSHGIGSAWQQNLIFGTSAGAANPWLWSLIHGVAVLFACAGMMSFWRVTEDSRREKDALSRQLSDAEIGRRARSPASEVVALIRVHHQLVVKGKPFGVEPIGRVLQVAPSTRYAAETRPPSNRALRDADVIPQLLAL